MSGVQRIAWRRLLAGSPLILTPLALAAIVIAAEIGLLIGLALVSGIAFHLAVHDSVGSIRTYGAVGSLTAILYVLPFLSRGEYGLDAFLAGARWWRCGGIHACCCWRWSVS